MSTTQANADSADRECPLIDGRREIQKLTARSSDVGGIPVARMLPSRHRRTIGAWCFLDHAGPVRFAPGEQGLQVGPHPHTSLQTFTWMITGEALHKDSLGSEQVIRPGQVNLMTAGKGITHTEQSLNPELGLHAAQLWIALPYAERHCEPRFDHYPELPRFALGELEATLLMGEYNERQAPTLAYSPLVGMDLQWQQAGSQILELRPDFEYGVVALEGDLELDGHALATDELAYLGINRESVTLTVKDRGRALLIGGTPLEKAPVIWWNFVGYSKDEVSEAQRQWELDDGRFGAVHDNALARMNPPAIPW
ncbi:pirin family protein [Marinimicrobium alkaliphilum]|uniref:pirin family protein n=1 Tax=Marinimicrobium alkaliphilum TaxID=2202654 RepID=UPI000DB9CC97|nr:pirin family protein [Marinimicrobium alkaliphilum]